MLAPLIIFVFVSYVLMSFCEYFVHGHLMHSPMDPGHLDHHMAVNLDMSLKNENGTYFQKTFAASIFSISFVVFLFALRLVRFLSRATSPYFQCVLASTLLLTAALVLRALVSYEKTGVLLSAEPLHTYEMALLAGASALLVYAPLAQGPSSVFLGESIDYRAAAVLAALFSLAYVSAWNYYHPRLHHCSFGKNSAEHEIGAYEKWVRRNHALHHLQKGSKKGNNNILIPLADHVLGKYNVCVDHEHFLREKQGGFSNSETELTEAMRQGKALPYDTHFCYHGSETGFTRLI